MNATRKPAVLAVSVGLRDARERRNIGLRELARMLGISAQKLSNVELGTNVPEPTLVAHILGCLRVSRTEFDQIMKIAKQIDVPNFVDQSASPLIDLLWTYEQLSSRIVEWAPFCIPDLLLPPPPPPAAARDEVTEQSERHDQELFHRQCRRQTMEQGGRRYVFLVGDEALRMARDEPDGAEQIRQLREAGRRLDVTIQIVPSGPDSAAAFTLFEDGSRPIAVALKHSHCTTFGTDKDVLNKYHDTARALLGRAFAQPVTIETWLDSLQARAS